MERFDIGGSVWGVKYRTDGLGAFCWAEEALNYQRSYGMALIFNVIISIICGVLAAYIVYHKHGPVPVQQAAVSTEEYAATVQEQRRLQIELSTAQKKIADLKAKSAQLEKMVKTQNIVLQQREQKLKDLQVSVPTQPVILEAIRKEASTEKGLRQAVARSFGGEIAGRVRVME